jgi:apolipoprotein N-acyltransferase
VLEVAIAGRAGTTPYMRVGDVAALVLCAVLIVAAFVASRRR